MCKGNCLNHKALNRIAELRYEMRTSAIFNHGGERISIIPENPYNKDLHISGFAITLNCHNFVFTKNDLHWMPDEAFPTEIQEIFKAG